MAWSESEKELDNAIGLDVAGWDDIAPATQSLLLAWILEDRTKSKSQKAEALIKRRESKQHKFKVGDVVRVAGRWKAILAISLQAMIPGGWVLDRKVDNTQYWNEDSMRHW